MNNQLSLSVTTYEGHEEEIIAILDRNRSVKHSIQYLNWRYRREENAPALIFWLRLSDGKAVGIASLIYNPYMINNHEKQILILGDIALDKEMRGKGYGQKLIRFINRYIEKNSSDFAFVIPNELAQKTLLASGWSRPYSLSSFVWIIDPVIKIFPTMRKHILLKLFRIGYRRFASMWFLLHLRENFRLEQALCFDESFNELWQSIDKRNFIVKDRSQISLNCRFKQHPHQSFQIHKIFLLDKMVGYIIFYINKKGICRIVDLMSFRVKYIRPMLALFLKKMCEKFEIQSVRIIINSIYYKIKHVIIIAPPL
ncbi:MAG: GNAT family N-acetyltransferase [Desulfobacterales bacterium]|nr:GNAT family N-acetyltransferase [Desulfobacterales bacterium]